MRVARRRAGRGRRGRAATRSPTSTAPARCCSRSAGSRAPTPSKSSTTSRSGSTSSTATLPPGYNAARRPRHVRVHRGVDPQRRGAPGRRLDPGRARRAAVPRQPALDDHRGDRDPDVDHRHVRPDLVHGLHAQHADDAGADARRSASSSTTRSSCSRTSTGSSRRSTTTSSRRRSRRRKEIGLAVLATTLSLVAIFVPVGFMGGIVGRFMKSFGLTMAFAIMVSLLVSFTLTPMLSARWLKVEDARQGPARARRTRGSSTPIDASTRGCSSGRWRTAAIVAGVAVLVLLSSVPLFMIAEQELPAEGRSVGVRDQPARARGHQPRVDRSASPTASRNAVRQRHAGGRLHAGDHRPAIRRRRATSATSTCG